VALKSYTAVRAAQMMHLPLDGDLGITPDRSGWGGACGILGAELHVSRQGCQLFGPVRVGTVHHRPESVAGLVHWTRNTGTAVSQIPKATFVVYYKRVPSNSTVRKQGLLLATMQTYCAS